MPQETKSIAPLSTEHAKQGLTAHAADPEALRKAIQLAVDYRGDVTITQRLAATRGGAQENIECYIFDVKESNGEMLIRAIPKDRDEKVSIPYSDIESLTFSGRDTAAGRSFDTWMKNYVKKKLAGEEASIQSESLD